MTDEDGASTDCPGANAELATSLSMLVMQGADGIAPEVLEAQMQETETAKMQETSLMQQTAFSSPATTCKASSKTYKLSHKSTPRAPARAGAVAMFLDSDDEGDSAVQDAECVQLVV